MTLHQMLPNNLLLRHVQNEPDRQSFAALSSIYNNPMEGATCAGLLHHHPQMTDEDFWLVEDCSTRQIVSTICLIPWTCHCAGLDLRVAQLEMVLTHPDYRSQGLVRTQIKQFLQEVKNREYDLSIIWGIPYYYRQYGFAYALDGLVTESLLVGRIPAGQPNCNLRAATVADIPLLLEYYGQSVAGLDIHLTRTPAHWEYLIVQAQHPVQIVEDQSGKVLGYAIVSISPERATVQEVGLPGADVSLDFLRWLKNRVSDEIIVTWPHTTHLVQFAHSLGSQVIPGGQWLLRVPNMARFLSKLAPLFEKRLAGSAWHGATTSLTINLFREAFRLRFENGQCSGVEALGFVDSSMGADGGELCIPAEAFIRLLFGYRSLSELFDAWPDITIKPSARLLVETLFPRSQGYLSTPYHYLGNQ